ncbi:unnamed protein product, partial [Pocillopora meandrina]
RRPRSCRRSHKNTGWWELVWASYDEGRCKKTFRVSSNTFNLILKSLRPDIEKDFVTEQSVSAESRLAICLYRLCRGDYLYTITELFGLIRNLWKPSVQAHFPITKQNIMEKMVDMTAFWQFPCCWSAVDGCHIPIQCPPG